MEYSNVIAASYDFRIQRGTDFAEYLQPLDKDGNPFDWTLYPGVRADVKNVVGNIVASFIMGDGLKLFPGDSTTLILYKLANEKNIPPGTYCWDLKVPFSSTQVEYPLRGNYYSVKYITQ